MGYPRGVQGSSPWPPLVWKLGASKVGLPWVLHDAIAVVGLLAFVCCCLLFAVCGSLLSFVVCLESRLRDDFFKSEAGAQRCHAMTVVLVDALYLAKVNELRPRAFVQGLPTWGARFNSLAATCAEARCFNCGFAVGATRRNRSCWSVGFVGCLAWHLRSEKVACFKYAMAGVRRGYWRHVATHEVLRPRAGLHGLPTWGARFNPLAATCAEAWCFECGFAVGATRCNAHLFVGLFCTAFDPGAVARELA